MFKLKELISFSHFLWKIHNYCQCCYAALDKNAFLVEQEKFIAKVNAADCSSGQIVLTDKPYCLG